MVRLQKISVTLVALLLLSGCAALQKGDRLTTARNALAIAYTGVTSANLTFSSLVVAGVIDIGNAEEISEKLTIVGKYLAAASNALNIEKDPETVLEYIQLANKMLLEILPILEQHSVTLRAQTVHNAI